MKKSFILFLFLTSFMGLAIGSLADVSPKQNDESPVYSYLVDENRESNPQREKKADSEFISSEDSLWNRIISGWKEIKRFYQIATAGETDNDKVQPTPIRTGALLLCFGIIGLIGFGFRRRYNRGDQ